MISSFSKNKSAVLAAVLGLTFCSLASAQTNFDVTTPASAFQYFIDGVNNTGTGMGSISGTPTNNCPPLTLAAGATYTFNISVAAFHPLGIVTTIPPSVSTYSNAAPQGLTTGTLTLTIPATDFPSTLYYQCNIHHFYGVITIVPPAAQPPPPANTIISIVVGPNSVTVTSNGTNTTYALVPQFNSNVLDGNWQDVPGFTNNFANGTNTTTFGRLDALCGSNVFVRISQRPSQ